jgi:dolichyl-phosphate beta-glucosyltransferase
MSAFDQTRVCLIIPCYNESKRLDMKAFIDWADSNHQVLFVDDGSQDRTVEFLREKVSQNPYLEVLAEPVNQGKAGAIRAAVLHLQKQNRLLNYDWVGFWDADLATPLYEVENMINFVAGYGTTIQSVWGSRVYRLGSHIVRSPLRHYLGRIFATVIALYLGVESYDSQCGAKLFRSDIVVKAFEDSFISRWIFDVEILLRLQQKNIVEYPLREWRDIPGSTLKVYKEIFRVGRDIRTIRRTYLS